MKRLFTSIFVLCLASPLLRGGLPQTWYSSTPTNKNLTAAMYGQGQLMVVGSGALILKSSDGFNWQDAYPPPPPNTGSGDDFYSAGYGNGTFVAGGKIGHLISISYDGSTWTNALRTLGSQRVYGLTYGIGRFVGVGFTGSELPIFIISSGDGIHWFGPTRYPTSNTLYGVTYGNNLFVAVGNLGTIITSPDGDTWTLQNSGTANNLRAITFTGSGFIAGGDSATIVISSDGINWSPGAPPAFDVKGLASGNGAVVAVGNYQNDGRLHASTDGLGWPGNPTLVSQPLNGVAYLNGRFVAVGNNGLILQSDLSTQNGINEWTKGTSGNWEEPYWSLGELPSTNHARIEIANSGFKAVAINYGTTINYPNSMRIRNLTIASPTNSYNTLLLNYAGLETPLDVSQDLVVNRESALVNYGSSLQANAAYMYGRATFAEGAQGRFNFLDVVPDSGELVISNASLSATYLGVFDALNQYGGYNNVGHANIWYGGSYNLYNGTLVVNDGVLISDQFGQPVFNGAGGSAQITPTLQLGNNSDGLSSGRLLLSGATMNVDRIDGYRGTITQTAGLLSVPNFVILYGGPSQFGTNIERGVYSLRGGRLDAWSLFVEGGRLEQSGGVYSGLQLSVEDAGRALMTGGTMRIDHAYVQAEGSKLVQSGGSIVISNGIAIGAQSGGEILITAGSFETPDGLYGYSGTFTQNGGTSFIRRMWLPFGPGPVTATLSSGTLTSGEVRLGVGPGNTGQGSFVQTGGLHINTNQIVMGGYEPYASSTSLGHYYLAGGRLQSPFFSINGGEFHQSGGTNVVANVSIAAGGQLLMEGGQSQAGNVVVGTFNDHPISALVQTGGANVIADTLTLVGIGDFRGGYLFASNIVISTRYARLWRRGPINIVNPGRFTLAGGGLYVPGGSNQLGQLMVSSSDSSFIEFGTGGSTILRFRDSHDLTWDGPALNIYDWGGSVAGGGADQIIVGNSAASLTSAQLTKIRFVNPAGFPSAPNTTTVYSAKILPTGEIIPYTTGPILASSRTAGGFTFAWDSSQYQLVSSTNVTGPYQPLNPQPSSPYTVSFSDPQRFFALRQAP